MDGQEKGEEWHVSECQACTRGVPRPSAACHRRALLQASCSLEGGVVAHHPSAQQDGHVGHVDQRETGGPQRTVEGAGVRGLQGSQHGRVVAAAVV